MAFLDTSFVIDLFRESHRENSNAARERLRNLGNEQIRISFFVCCELESGVIKAKDGPKERKRLQEFYKLVEIVYPDSHYPQLYVETLHKITLQGKTVPQMDLLIGISALQVGETLITRNIRDFQKIPGLRIGEY